MSHLPRVVSCAAPLLLLALLFGAPATLAASPFMMVDTPAASDAAAASPHSPNEDASSEDEADLAKKTLNPVANLISVPFQYNADLDIGPSGATRQILNIQPVIPVTLNQDWNLI